MLLNIDVNDLYQWSSNWGTRTPGGMRGFSWGYARLLMGVREASHGGTLGFSWGYARLLMGVR